jgi:hypothetical protein
MVTSLRLIPMVMEQEAMEEGEVTGEVQGMAEEEEEEEVLGRPLVVVAICINTHSSSSSSSSSSSNCMPGVA